jgi:iron uptake system EfeUOB component EfeO/EfeM
MVEQEEEYHTSIMDTCKLIVMDSKRIVELFMKEDAEETPTEEQLMELSGQAVDNISKLMNLVAQYGEFLKDRGDQVVQNHEFLTDAVKSVRDAMLYLVYASKVLHYACGICIPGFTKN